MIKVSAVCPTFRPGYIDSLVDGLSRQTLSQDEWELILVDDLFEQRGEAVRNYVSGKIRNFKHMLPRELKPFFAAASAMNTGILHARGELVYFINDAIYASPRCLERHWEIFQKHGPKVLISGPLIDALVVLNISAWGANKVAMKVFTPIQEDGKLTYLEDITPPIEVPLKDNFYEAVEANFISVFKEPFVPPELPNRLPDWRSGMTANFTMGGAVKKQSTVDNLFENTLGGTWWWAGRNDSAPLEALLEINGFDEGFDGQHDSADADAGQRMVRAGYRHLIDAEAPCYELIHPFRKKCIVPAEERAKEIEEQRKTRPVPNEYSLRKERER